MARPTSKPVSVEVTIDRETFDKLNQVYAAIGVNFLEEFTKELQQAANNSIASKVKIFEGFSKKPE